MLVCGAIMAYGSIARAASISGYVREEGSRESVPYVSVYLDALRIGAMTNVSGYYVITGVPAGEITLVSALIGFQEHREQIAMGTEDIVRNIVMKPEAIEVEAVEVTAERVKSPSLEIAPSRQVLRGADLKIAPAAVEADPIRTLQTLPGVVQLSDFNTGLYIRGGTPDQNLILMDGAELYNVSHFFGLFSTFPADAIKTTELLTGAYPAQYGGRLSSVLNVTTDEGNKEKLKGSGGISLLSSRLTLQSPVGENTSFLISGRRTYLEPILDLAGVEDIGYYFYDLQGKIHHVFSHTDQLSIAGYLGSDVLSITPNFLDARLQWGNWSGAAIWTHLFSNTFYSRFQANLSRFKSNLKMKFEDVGFDDTNELFDLDARADFTWFANEEHTIEAGVHFKRHTMKLAQEFGGERFEAFNIEAFVPAVYAQDIWKPWPFLTIQPGVRASYFTGDDRKGGTGNAGTSNYSAVNPRVSMRYQLGEDTFLKAAVGRYSQYIFRVPREIQGIDFLSAIWFTCGPGEEGGPQHAWHYITGYETRLGESFDLSVEAYYKSYKDLSEFDFKAETPESTSEALLRGDGYSYGLDVSLKKRAGRHKGWVSYAISWVVRDFEGINKTGDGEYKPYYPKYDSRHHLDMIYSFDLSESWTLSSRYSFATGQGYTRTLGLYAVEGPIFRLGGTHRDRLNATRLPYYSRLDVGIRGRFKGWGITWMPFFQVVNVLDRENEFNRYFDDGDPNASPPEFAKEEKITQLPLLPTIGLDLEF